MPTSSRNLTVWWQKKYIRNVPEIEKYVIMPDHIHMIIRLENSIKVLAAKEIGESVFQRSHYDHVIRN